jgi:hypothetical protein
MRLLHPLLLDVGAVSVIFFTLLVLDVGAVTVVFFTPLVLDIGTVTELSPLSLPTNASFIQVVGIKMGLCPH